MKRLSSLLLCLFASASLVSCSVASTGNTVGFREYRNDNLPADVEVIKDIEYGKVGDVSLRLNIVRPKDAKDPLPVIVFIHGGGWNSGNKDDDTGLLCGFAKQGYVGVSVEYRFVDVARFPAQIEDCKCAIRFLKANAEQYGIEADRIGVWGDSAGGHLAALLGTSGGVKELEGRGGWQDTSSSVNAVCDWYGPVGLADIPLSDDHPYSQLLGSTPRANPELARLSDPVSFISEDDPPILIMHGDKDELVPIVLSEQFYQKLKQGGVDATMETVKGAGHGNGFWGNMEIYGKVLGFFNKTLKK